MLAATLDILLRLAKLAMPAVIGAAVAGGGVMPSVRQAISAMNVYAVYVAFPCLLANGLLSARFELPTDVAFWVLWPLGLGVSLVCARVVARLTTPSRAATLALVLSFGNVAYLGLPYLDAVMGDEVAGVSSLAVALHVIFAVGLGPMLLLAWSGGDVQVGASLKRLALQPLLLAPVAALMLRWAPEHIAAGVATWIAPIAASAAPVALFMLGMYVYQERRRLVRIDGWVIAHIGARMILAPCLVLLAAAGFVAAGLLSPELGMLHVILASMPAAITTFSIAHDYERGEEVVASTIVWSSVLALVGLPAWTFAARAVLGG